MPEISSITPEEVINPQKVNVFQFMKPMATQRYYFGVGSKETFLQGLRNFMKKVEDGEISMQGVEVKEVATLEDFTVTELTFKFVEKS